MKVAVIGFGNWGKQIYKNLKILKIKNIEVIKNIFSNIEKQNEYIKKKIKKNKYDSVFLSADPETNARILKISCMQSTSVFVEKPLFLNNTQLSYIEKLCKKNHLTVSVNYLYYKYLKKIRIPEKKLDKIFFYFSNKKITTRKKMFSIKTDWLSHILPILFFFFKIDKFKILNIKNFLHLKNVCFLHIRINNNFIVKIIIGDNYLNKRKIILFKNRKVIKVLDFKKYENKNILLQSIKEHFRKIKSKNYENQDLVITKKINKFLFQKKLI